MTHHDSPSARLRDLRERSGLSMAALAKAIGLKGASSYQRYEDESLFKKPELPLHLVRALDKVLTGRGSPPITKREVYMLAGLENLSLAQLRSMEDQAVIWCTGEVAAGVWRDAFEWPRDEWLPFPVMLLDQRYPEAERRALRVVGDSMDQLYPDGSYVVYVRLEDISRKAQTGDRVVVLRHRQGLTEATVKEYKRDGAQRRWLIPHSSNPEHTAIPITDAGDEADEIQIFGLVVGSQRIE